MVSYCKTPYTHEVTTDEKGVETEVSSKTAKELFARARERKLKIMLLAILDEYQLRFHAIKDAKSLWAAIKSRFGGNVESKKMQRLVFDSRSSDGDDNQTNDRFKKDNRYHVVPPPLTGNYITSLADLSFAGLDDSVYKLRKLRLVDMTGYKNFITDYQTLMEVLLLLVEVLEVKNSVLFTETECLLLSSDFKLLDESQVLLRVPRQSNCQAVILKNVVPSGDLTCLFAKAIIDESKLWHRRLGHVNFKTMNKLVKGNLVRANLKGLLHMDLFGPTSVRSINHKTYCLVVTDDFRRFSWVFFLTSKDKTSGILKRFIT
ncbi:putative ribonuclease H-like domain-containing protein [Tanacetum coccineum]